MSAALIALLPFIAIAVIALLILVVMDYVQNKKIDVNLKEVAAATGGTLTREDGYFLVEGKYNNKKFNIFIKPRGIGKSKALYYHIKLESEAEARLVSLKRYVKSRLEAKINEMHAVKTGDEEFDAINKIMFENEELGQKMLAKQETVEMFKKIMEKYTEMSIKKNITLLKRYNVMLTDPKSILETLDILARIATEVEAASKQAV